MHTASELHFEDEATGLELNHKMKQLRDSKARVKDTISTSDSSHEKSHPIDAAASSQGFDTSDNERKRQILDESQIVEYVENKKARLDKDEESLLQSDIKSTNADFQHSWNEIPILKFRYVESVGIQKPNANSDYRVLLATYANVDAASEGDPKRAHAISNACVSGGDFVDDFFYQFEGRFEKNFTRFLNIF